MVSAWQTGWWDEFVDSELENGRWGSRALAKS